MAWSTAFAVALFLAAGLIRWRGTRRGTTPLPSLQKDQSISTIYHHQMAELPRTLVVTGAASLLLPWLAAVFR
ncbi:MAG: hypothetical protein R2733_01860 [Acidimicrobiales bacterium]